MPASRHPQLFLLVPQIGLGVLALAVARDTAVVVAPAAAAAALASLVAAERHIGREALTIAALILTILGIFFTTRDDRRGWWPAVLFVWPVLLLSMGLRFTPRYSFESRKVVLAWTVLTLLTAAAALLAAVHRRRSTPGRCAPPPQHSWPLCTGSPGAPSTFTGSPPTPPPVPPEPLAGPAAAWAARRPGRRLG
ncbi:hypothetical protein AB0M02_27065 [Actinoplanes sp. NPDC051861]|uniref:hypothetical protein n=1 Tax=Actinoplanes sp. NPDC051861 TaxID=3155170 RepID=UPI0034289592